MNRHCIKCGKEIKLIYEPEKNSPPERCLWDGGIVEKISGGGKKPTKIKIKAIA